MFGLGNGNEFIDDQFLSGAECVAFGNSFFSLMNKLLDRSLLTACVEYAR